MHLAAASDAFGDDTGALQAAVPPLVQTVDAHRLRPGRGGALLFRPAPGRARVAAAEQVVIGLGAPVEDVPLQVVPKRGLHDRNAPHLCALREDGEATALVVEA